MEPQRNRAANVSALIIAHEADGPGGEIAICLAERGYVVTTHVVTADHQRPNSAVPFPSFADYDVVAIMGSVRSLTNKDEISSWVYEELALIRQAFAAGQPVLGVCFGGQLIAEALGGRVEVSPTTEIGWFRLSEVDGVTNPIGPGPWMEWHHDRFTAPPGSTILAETNNGPQLFTIGSMVGTQFHPEVNVAHVQEWLASADAHYLAEYGQEADEVLADVRTHEARNREQCKELVDWFLEISGAHALVSPPSPRVSA
ncbi:MAG: type 1 glutamine amidotransferase [Acidimicrobiales bacterium]|nr:type 1 glutamine amidotransferase [Acidimicrobiales bacterium]